MGSKIFEKRIKEVAPEIRIVGRLLLDISDQIHEYLTEKGMTQRELAQRLGKKEAEISKWMSGTHNFTMLTIAKISAVLERPILTTLLYVDELKERDKEYVLGKLGGNQVEDSDNRKIPSFAVEKLPILLENGVIPKHLNSQIFNTYTDRQIEINNAKFD